MIEVEKKFMLGEGDEARLIVGAEFVSEKEIHDVYYDLPGYPLSIQEKWLRQRDGRWELKLPLTVVGQPRLADQFRELETEGEIRSALNLPESLPLGEAIQAAGYFVIVDVRTRRRKYRVDPFTIDIDTVDFGYSLAEVERLIEQESDMAKTVAEIESFARGRGLALAPVRGKVTEYIRHNNPDHYRLLQAAGVC